MCAKISASEPQVPVKLKGNYEGNTIQYLWKRGKKIRGKTLRKIGWQSEMEGMPRETRKQSNLEKAVFGIKSYTFS